MVVEDRLVSRLELNSYAFISILFTFGLHQKSAEVVMASGSVEDRLVSILEFNRYDFISILFAFGLHQKPAKVVKATGGIEDTLKID